MFRHRSVVLGAALALAGASVFGQAGRFGVFDGHLDVGAPKLAGTAMYDAVSQEYTVMAGGVNMWGVRDEFHFVWKRMTGDFTLQTRVELVGREPTRIARPV